MMTTDSYESITQKLILLNTEIGEMEQKGGDATAYFTDLLSEQLIFRRATGKALSKADFIKNLVGGSPFTSRHAENIVVNPIGDRILVTLIVIGTKEDGSEQRFRNVRLFSQFDKNFILEFWYNYELTSL